MSSFVPPSIATYDSGQYWQQAVHSDILNRFSLKNLGIILILDSKIKSFIFTKNLNKFVTI